MAFIVNFQNEALIKYLHSAFHYDAKHPSKQIIEQFYH